LVKLFRDPQFLQTKQNEEVDSGMTEIDFEEATAGYQAAYSRIAASEVAAADPVGYVGNVQEYLGQQLAQANKADSRIKDLVQAGDAEIVGQFLKDLASGGYIS
jgi:exportin-2 (importin alpha re-exporter)